MEVSVNKKSINIEPDNKVIEYSEAAGIPKKYVSAIWSQVEFKTQEQKAAKDIIKNFINYGIRQGRNLIYTGEYGTGKTFCSILTANTCYQYRRVENYFYTKTSSLLSCIKNDFNTDSRETFDKAVNTDLLILDEFGRDNWSDFDKLTMFNIIDDRYSNMQSIIFITNMSKNELFKNLEPSIVSRLVEDTVFVDFGKTDLRKIRRITNETI